MPSLFVFLMVYIVVIISDEIILEDKLSDLNKWQSLANNIETGIISNFCFDSPCLQLNNNDTITLTNNVDISQFNRLNFTFYIGCQNLFNNDILFIQVSYDNGNTWINTKTILLNQCGHNNVIIVRTIHNTCKFRFNYLQTNGTLKRLYIDDIVFKGSYGEQGNAPTNNPTIMAKESGILLNEILGILESFTPWIYVVAGLVMLCCCAWCLLCIMLCKKRNAELKIAKETAAKALEMSVQIHRKDETKSIDSTPREAPTYKSLDGPKHTDIDTDDFEYKNDTENSLSNDNNIIPDKKRKETAKKLFKEMMDDPELMELMYKKMNKQKLKEGRQKRAKTQELVTQNYGPQRPHAYSATMYSGNNGNGNNNQIYSNNNRMNINGNNKVINYQPNMYPNNNNRHVLYSNNNSKSHAQTTRPNMIYYGSYNNILRAQQNGVPLNNFQRIVSPQYQRNAYQNHNNNSNKGNNNMQLNQNNGYSQPNISQSKSHKSITQTTTYQSSQPSGQVINYSISSMNNISKTQDTQLDKVPPPPKMPNMPPVLQMNKYSQTGTQTVVKLDEGDTPASSSTDETESTSDE